MKYYSKAELKNLDYAVATNRHLLLTYNVSSLCPNLVQVDYFDRDLDISVRIGFFPSYIIRSHVFSKTFSYSVVK